LALKFKAEQKRYDLAEADLERARKKLSLAAGAGQTREIARYEDGGRLLENQTGAVLLQSPIGRAEATTLKTHRVSLPQHVARLIDRRETRMGGSDSERTFLLLRPVGTLLLSSHPTFVWQTVKDAVKYTVKVLDPDSHPVAEATVEQTEWSLPSSVVLDSSTVYTWSVAARDNDDKPIAEAPRYWQARFQILGSEEALAIERLRGRYAASHLLSGIFYANQGLLDDAEREFTAHLAANPSDPMARKI